MHTNVSVIDRKKKPECRNKNITNEMNKEMRLHTFLEKMILIGKKKR